MKFLQILVVKTEVASAMHLDPVLVADDHELTAAFQKVETPAIHLFQQSFTSDLTLDQRDRAAHDRTFFNGFRRENLPDPDFGLGMRDGVHDASLSAPG